MLVSATGAAMTAADLWNDNEVNVGIGFGNFTGDLGSLTSAGVSWNGRVGINPSPYWGAELNYQGINTGVAAILPATGTVIVGQSISTNELTIDGKGGYPFAIPGTNQILKPYGFVGIGWAGTSSNATLTAIGLQASDAFAIPIGIGAEYKFTDVFAADSRFTYNFLTGTRTTIAPTGDSWDFLVSIGAHFGRGP
jgi:hypothetical protein